MNKIYSRLAFTNIKNNKTLYMPYIISGMVMIAMFYVMMFLNNSKGLGKVPGAEILVDIMGLGCGIIAIFSYIFLFYTSIFLSQERLNLKSIDSIITKSSFLSNVLWIIMSVSASKQIRLALNSPMSKCP